MKKNKIIIGSSVAALAIIGMGAFAFFSDYAEDDTVGTVGTVDVSVSEGGALDLSNKENINPGDEKTPYDPENPGATTPHKLSFGVQNDGTKSIRTRNIIDIIVTSADGENLDPTIFALSEKDGQNVNHELSTLEDLDVTKFTYVNDDNQTVLRYIITGASLNGEAGKLEDADIAADDVVRDSVAVLDEDAVNAVMYDYYLSMEGYREVADGDDVVIDALDAYQGATVQINLEVQAMQYRNTTGNDIDGDWTTVLVDTVIAGN